MTETAFHAQPDSPLEAYKAVLQKVIETRPSGTRQRLAEALGKNRSFVSQITNPAYVTPVPVQHLEIIFHICHFSGIEKREFLAAYRAAHPGRLEQVDALRQSRTVTIDLPDFGNVQMNRRVDDMVHSLVRGIHELFLENMDDKVAPTGEETK
jgi:hypothetical protein